MSSKRGLGLRGERHLRLFENKCWDSSLRSEGHSLRATGSASIARSAMYATGVSTFRDWSKPQGLKPGYRRT